MTSTVRITEGDLRAAMRDARYYTPNHPEREAYVGWVTEGYQALGSAEAKDGVVHVRAYSRSRGGKSHHVDAYTRQAVQGSGDEARVVLAQAALPGQMSDAGPALVPVLSEVPAEDQASKNRQLARNLTKGMGIEAELPEGKEEEALPGLILLSQYRSLTQTHREEALTKLNAVFGRDNPAFMREIQGAASIAVTRDDLQPGLLSNRIWSGVR